MRVYTSIVFVFMSVFAFSQCYPDRHNNNWEASWQSCEAKANVNDLRGNGHWILYDFGYIYNLQESKIWNYNVRESLENGIQKVAIDYSMDGRDWTEFGEFDFEMATGFSNYQGQEGPHFDGINARYILITILENHGGTCYGLSEIQFQLGELEVSGTINSENDIAIYPNPVNQILLADLSSISEDAETYVIYDMLGRMVDKGNINIGASSSILQITTNQLVAGHYLLSVQTEDDLFTQKFIKQ